jgi:hypothetical protein
VFYRGDGRRLRRLLGKSPSKGSGPYQLVGLPTRSMFKVDQIRTAPCASRSWGFRDGVEEELGMGMRLAW